MSVDYLSKLPKRRSGGSEGGFWNKGPKLYGRTGWQFYVRGYQGGCRDSEGEDSCSRCSTSGNMKRLQ